MNRMTVLIALLGLALFAGCNQSDGSGSEWICAEGRVGNPNDQDWQCYSQLGWQQCSFKYVCEDIAAEEWFCDKLGSGRKYNEICDDQYICEDLAGHYWACDSEATWGICETEYFGNPSDFFLCNAADRDQDPAEYWACPDLGENIPLPPNFREIKLRTLVPNNDPPPDFNVTSEDIPAPCNLDAVGEGCTYLGGDECVPLWSISGRSLVDPTEAGDPPTCVPPPPQGTPCPPPPEDKGEPKNYCNPVSCTRI